MAKHGDPARSTDQVRKDFLARYDRQVVRLEDELAEFIKLIAHQRRALTAEAFDGLGHLALATSKEVLDKLAKLGASFNSATDAKVRLEKTAKERSKTMTPEDEEAAVLDFFRSRPETQRGRMLRDLVAWHNEAVSTPNVRVNP